MSLHDEALREFLVESGEGLDQLEREFIALEADPSARERLAIVFRAVHTIKGTSGFFGFSRLENLTHVGESLLSRLRDGTLALTPEITSALLAMADRIRRILRAIELDGSEGHESYDDLVARLGSLATCTPAAPPAPGPPPGSAQSLAAPPPTAQRDASPDPRPPATVAAVPEAAFDPAPPREAAGTPAASDSSIRVDLGLLDRLMNLVGELVLARNQIIRSGARVEDPAFTAAAQRLDLITTELQEGVMKTRMQPIRNLWNKLPRIVRDLATGCGKQVRIEMTGKDTELDRTILEAIKDPITHLVRNAIDHGIEAPAVRAARGKPRTGTLSLRAYHEGGQVVIEISDDGAGLDTEAIRQKAVDGGLVAAERVARMTERELAQLIFLPGFTTTAKVTSMSGRGVGMDVVKSNVEKIGGMVDLQSASGGGTRLRLKIPLTLAIVPALIVTSAGDRYAIPQVSLLELVRLEGEAATSRIEMIHGSPVYRLRGNLLPLVYLDQALELDRRPGAAPAGEEVVNIVVLAAGEQVFGLVVDGIHDNEEIVVKPLCKDLKSISCFAGATIMGDGLVALIIDVIGIAQRAGFASESRESVVAEQAERAAVVPDRTRNLLLFESEEDGSMAIPLSMVARLEEFPTERVERSGRRDVVQYRGSIMPLVHLSAMIHGTARQLGDSIQVVVYSNEGRSVGIVVDQIVDVIEQSVAAGDPAADGDHLGAVIIEGRVTELLDIRRLLAAYDSSLLKGEAHEA